MLRMICRVSLSPDSCVGNTRRIYARWGAPSLIVAKYVPGLAAVANGPEGPREIRLAQGGSGGRWRARGKELCRAGGELLQPCRIVGD